MTNSRCKSANMKQHDYSKTWYHGSPFKLTTLRKGSTITQDRGLAKVFSHKPTLVSISDEGHIKHDGRMRGFLYRIIDDIEPGDVHRHPRSPMGEGEEWLTDRELRVELIGRTQIIEQERLTEEEISRLTNILGQKEEGATRKKLIGKRHP